MVPTSFSLKPGQSCNVDVCLRVLKFAQKRKAAEQGQRDVFHIKARPDDAFPLYCRLGLSAHGMKAIPLANIAVCSFPSCCIVLLTATVKGVQSSLQAAYFDQNFSSTFFLHPEEAGLPMPSAAASASKNLQRLKRNPSQLPEAQTTHDRSSSDRTPRSARVGFESEEHTDRRHEQSMGSQEAEQQQQSQIHAVEGSHEKAHEQRQEGMPPDRPHGHEEAPAHYEKAEEQAAAKQMFSLDRYFLPLKKQPNGQAEHAMLHSPAQEDFLQGSPQDFRDTAMQLSSANAAGKDIEEELLLTIEEQDQALG